MNNNKIKKYGLFIKLFTKRKGLLLLFVLSCLFGVFIKRKFILKKIYQFPYLPDYVKLFIEQTLLSYEDYDESSTTPRIEDDNNVYQLFKPSSLFSAQSNNQQIQSQPSPSSSSGGLNKRVSFNELFKKKICISTIGVIFKKNVYYEHISDKRISQIKFIESERDCLLRLAKETDLYLITQSEDEMEEDQVMQALKQYGIIDAGLNQNKILFCSTSQGKAHISRHLESYLHIDVDIEVLSMIKQYVNYLVLIGSSKTTTTTTTTTTTQQNNSNSNISSRTLTTTTSLSTTNIMDVDRQKIFISPSLHDYFKL